MKPFEFKPHYALELHRQKQYLELTKELAGFINFFVNNAVHLESPELTNILEITSTILFNTLATEDYIIPEDYVLTFVTAAPFLSHLASITGHKTTDGYLHKVLLQKNNTPKILALYNFRCKTHIPLEALFKASPSLATYWWAVTLDQSRAVTEANQNKLESILGDEGAINGFNIQATYYTHIDWITHPAFSVCYIKPELEKKVKEAVNAELRKVTIKKKEGIQYNMKKILVVSHSFRKEHAVYKSIAEYFKPLKGHYHLTLLHLNLSANESDKLMDRELFDEIHYFMGKDGKLPEAIKLLEEGDHGVIIYPDVSLAFNTEVLANTRLAPIQITTYGHPVSTHSSEIDYFIGGADTETPETYGNYSERLILLPGSGNAPVRVDHKITMFEKGMYRIGCSWGYIKLNYAMIKILKEIQKKADKPFRFAISGIYGQSLALLAIKRELTEELGDNFDITPNTDRVNYMKMIESTKFGLDSYPFGGFNRVLDSLLCHKPILVLQGDRAYNRMHAAYLRNLGLSELVCNSPEEMVEKAVYMLENNEYRISLIEKLEKMDFFGIVKTDYFRRAIDFVIDNHNALQVFKNKKPIFIK